MRTALFDYELPEELIATRPPQDRSGGRLCIVEGDRVRHGLVRDWASQLEENDLVVLNETRVRRARLTCRRVSHESGGGGGKVELLFLRACDAQHWEALGRANRPLRPGDSLMSGALFLTIVEKGEGGVLRIRAEGNLEAELEQHGKMPIPPYMARASDDEDVQRYQTVFAKTLGSAAAPTAGLHLTTDMLDELAQRGVERATVLLHVGIGTFRPVTSDDLDDHPMHSEYIEVGSDAAEAVARARARGGRVVAVGTTVVRALESSSDGQGRVVATKRETDLLIQPGYRFSVVDALLTNFHQPKSTLLALVAAFAGYDTVMKAYEEAVEQKYQFLSYGDAMWIPQRAGDSKGKDS